MDIGILHLVKNRIKQHGRLIYMIETGSSLYGLRTTESDVDYVGVFMASDEYYYGLKKIEKIDLSEKDKDSNGKNTKNAIDIKIYELKKFVDLCYKNNPNIIEMLYANNINILHEDEMFKEFKEVLKKTITKRGINHSFYNYMISQKKKMFEKVDNLNFLIDGVVAMERMINDTDSKKLLIELKNHKQFKKYFKINNDYISLGNVRNYLKSDTLETVYKKIKSTIDSYGNRNNSMSEMCYDKKSASHLFRLAIEGSNFHLNGKIELPFKGEEKKFLMDIKTGKMNRNDIIKLIDEYIEKYNNAYKNSILIEYGLDINDINYELISFIKRYRKLQEKYTGICISEKEKKIYNYYHNIKEL